MGYLSFSTVEIRKKEIFLTLLRLEKTIYFLSVHSVLFKLFTSVYVDPDIIMLCMVP